MLTGLTGCMPAIVCSAGALAARGAGVGSGGDSDVGPVSCGVEGPEIALPPPPHWRHSRTSNSGRCFIPNAVFIGRC